MGSAFSEKERAKITENLKRAGREYIARYGIRKTTVEQLSAAAGISTGAFYRFFETKELLFFEVIEDMHEEFYGQALSLLQTRTDLPQEQRMELAIMAFFAQMREVGVSDVWENDMEYLLRKIPAPVLQNHWSDDRTHIRELIEHSGLRLKVSTEEATAVLYLLTMLLPAKNRISPQEFETSLRLLVRGACRELTGS